MKDSLFFSIIIPTLNEEKFLPKLLTDLKNQKEKNFEVIVTDGKSFDNTKEKSLAYTDYFSIKFYTCDKKNVSYQRNFGANVSNCRYLIFLDADSRVNSTFTKSLKKFILQNGGLVVMPYCEPDEKDPQIQFLFKMANAFTEFAQIIGNPVSRVGCMIWERSFFLLLGGFNDKLFINEDYDIVKRAYKWGVKSKFVNNIKIKYSLRRMRREGRLKYFYKSVFSTVHDYMNDGVKKKIFEYEMGGAVKNSKKEHLLFKNNFKESLRQLKDFLIKD